MCTNKILNDAFASLFSEEPVINQTPWERSHMSYAEWHKMYVKAIDDAVRWNRQLEEGHFINEEVFHE